MSMSGGGGGGRDLRMDSTLPTVDADGKEGADNDTNGDSTDSPNNVITRSNIHASPRIQARFDTQSIPTALNIFAGPSVPLQQPPAARASIDEIPISPTSVRAPQEEELRGRPPVRLPPQVPPQVNTDERHDTVSQSPTSIRALPEEEPPVSPRVRLPLPFLAQVNTNNRSDNVGTTESPISPSTLPPDQALPLSDQEDGEITTGAANALLMLADDNLNARPHDSTPDLQANGVSSRDFATDPVPAPVDRSSVAPPDEPNLDQQARSIPSSDSGAGMLRLPQPAQFLLPSDSSSVASTPPRMPVNTTGHFRTVQQTRVNGSTHGPPQPRRDLGRRVRPMPREVVESTATSLAPTPIPQMTALQQVLYQRREVFDNLRRTQVYLEQRMRIRFAPPTPSTVRIQQRFATMQHGMQRERRLSVQFPEMDPTRYTPVRSARERRRDARELTQQSRDLDYRLRALFGPARYGEPARQMRDREEQIASVRHARELDRRLSFEIGELDLQNGSPGVMEPGFRPSPMPLGPHVPSGTDALVFNRHLTRNAERLRNTQRRNEPMSSTVHVHGRTPPPVIANGRTPEQRLADPLPDVRKFHAAVNGNPAISRWRRFTEGEASRSSHPRPQAWDENVGSLLMVSLSQEMKAVLRTLTQPETHDESEPLSPTPSLPRKDEAGPSSRGRSPPKGKGRLVAPPPTDNEAGTTDRTQPEANVDGNPTSPTAYSPIEGEAGPSNRSPPRRSPRRADPPPPPGNPFHGGMRLHRVGTGPARFITPIAVQVPGDTLNHVAPPPTARRERRRDENFRLLDTGLSDESEGSERVIASSSSDPVSDGEANLDADDEDIGGDPVVENDEGEVVDCWLGET